MKLTGFMRPREEDTLFEFGVMVAGRAKLYIDGELQRRGNSFFNTGTEEERGQFLLKKGVAHAVYLEFGNIRGPAEGDIDEVVLTGGPGVKLGGAPVVDETEEVEKAVVLAKDAEVAIVVVGLNANWETEGYYRTNLKLPGKTDELVKRFAEANPRTVVVLQAVGYLSALIFGHNLTDTAIGVSGGDAMGQRRRRNSWYLGNSAGHAIADVLFGKVNPSAKLSMEFPKRVEDTPSYGHLGSENGTVWYAEDLFVGYKHYTNGKQPTLFPFGHGLSYTSFAFSDLKVSTPTGPKLSFVASVKVENTGPVKGSEVVQIYVTPSSTTKLTHPLRRLAGYNKAHDIAPGTSVEVEVKLDKYALSYWCVSESRWKIEKGICSIIVGAGADDVCLTAQVEITREKFWDGL